MAANPSGTWNDHESSDTWTNDGEGGDGRQRTSKCGRRCKIVLKHLFSHVGLTLIIITYSIIGGFIFRHLEETNEKQECIKLMNKYTPLENKTAYNIWEIAKVYVDEFEQTAGSEATKLEDAAKVEFEKILRGFQTDLLELKYDGKNCTFMGEADGPGYRWSFAGALLFAVTVITTIGEYLKKFGEIVLCSPAQNLPGKNFFREENDPVLRFLKFSST